MPDQMLVTEYSSELPETGKPSLALKHPSASTTEDKATVLNNASNSIRNSGFICTR